MALCKCFAQNSKSKSVSDNHSGGIIFSLEEYLCFFKDIHRDNTTMRIYIDRKKELLLVPEFENEGYSHPMPLNYFSRLLLFIK